MNGTTASQVQIIMVNELSRPPIHRSVFKIDKFSKKTKIGAADRGAEYFNPMRLRGQDNNHAPNARVNPFETDPNNEILIRVVQMGATGSTACSRV